jgi:hypothetical protein
MDAVTTRHVLDPLRLQLEPIQEDQRPALPSLTMCETIGHERAECVCKQC